MKCWRSSTRIMLWRTFSNHSIVPSFSVLPPLILYTHMYTKTHNLKYSMWFKSIIINIEISMEIPHIYLPNFDVLFVYLFEASLISMPQACMYLVWLESRNFCQVKPNKKKNEYSLIRMVSQWVCLCVSVCARCIQLVFS